MSYGDWRGIEGRGNSQRGSTPDDRPRDKREDRMSWVWGIAAFTLIICGGAAHQPLVVAIGLGLLIKAVAM